MGETLHTLEEIQQFVSEHEKVLPVGRRTKPALSTPPETGEVLEMVGLAGIVTYDPHEYTITALSGTRLAEIEQRLAENQQYLPFDPPLVRRGATLGGAVASGLNGPGRYRYGGMRDFLLAIQYINAAGELVRSGSKVVKNAAGFDISKLMIGSLGRLGVLTELTFKVFPRPRALVTVQRDFSSLEQALPVLWGFARSQLDLETLDLEVSAGRARLEARIGGLSNTIVERGARLQEAVGGDSKLLEAETETQHWETVREFDWVPAEWSLVKVALTPSQVPILEKALSEEQAIPPETLRRYSSGGQQAWIAIPGAPQALDCPLCNLGLAGLAVFGPAGSPQLGAPHGAAFASRVKTALDPIQRFMEA